MDDRNGFFLQLRLFIFELIVAYSHKPKLAKKLPSKRTKTDLYGQTQHDRKKQRTANRTLAKKRV